MSIYNKFLESIVLPLGDFVLGTKYMHHLDEWRGFQKLSSAELKQIQKERLGYILDYACNHVPYYKKKNIELSREAYDDILEFPVLYKNEIKLHEDDFVVGDKSKLIVEKSSGSSGIQGQVYLSKAEASLSQAIQTLWWEWAGYKFGNAFMQTGMSPKRGVVKRIKDILLNTEYVVAYNITEQEAADKLKKLSKKKFKHLGGYASSLYVYASIAERNNIKDLKFDSAISWGDKMFPHYRQLLEKQFGAKVYDTYGCTEGFMIAGQCSHGQMHIMSPHVYVEILDDDGNPVPAGQLGKVVVTRLDSFSMPLIRYYLGDLAILAPDEKKCDCGMDFPILEKIIGRDTDIVKTRSNKFMIVHFFTGILEHFPEIKQFRVIQKNLDSIQFEYIKDTGFNQSVLDKITQIIHEHLQEKFPIEYIEVDHIPSTPSGKPQLILSQL